MTSVKEEFQFTFKQEIAFETRKQEAKKILTKFQGRIPVVIERSVVDTKTGELKQTKYLIPADFTFQQFIHIIRSRLGLSKAESLFVILSGNKVAQSEKSMGQVYEEHKDDDGFLYCKYSSENFTG
jgi:GABA(A) receptor-associated protein